YELPQAKEKVRLARMGEQPGFMGLGMYEVDLYYDSIRRQIAHIRDKLRNVRKKRSLHRARRVELGFSLVSLAGYTNSGKSTLFNSLTEESAPVDSGLFTTLSTTTRALELSRKRVLLTDTVGFIDRLPLTLIEAFHSTLEETIFSDLIVLMLDISETQKEIERKLSCCLDTIQRIGVEGVPIVTALNKIDLISKEEMQKKMEALKGVAPNPVPISALQKTNLNQLKEEITRHLKNYVQASFSLPVTGGTMALLSWLSNRADINSIKYEGNTMNVHFGATPWFAGKVKERVKQLGGTFNK
ncbi:MAG: GTPase, partial [Candidatus Bathyarchaeia archaeon]